MPEHRMPPAPEGMWWEIDTMHGEWGGEYLRVMLMENRKGFFGRVRSRCAYQSTDRWDADPEVNAFTAITCADYILGSVSRDAHDLNGLTGYTRNGVKK